MVLLAARGPAFPTARQTSLDFAARTGAPRVLTAEGRSRMAAGPRGREVVHLPPLRAATPESEPRVQFQGETRGSGAPRFGYLL